MAFTTEDYAALLESFKQLSDEKYRNFHAGLVPGTTVTYGVRVPQVRNLAKEIIKNDPEGYLSHFVPNSYEEIMLCGFVIAGMKTSFAQKIPLIENFLPHIDNWAICDTFCCTFKCKPNELPLLWAFICPLFLSNEVYTARFAIVMFLAHLITEDYIAEGLHLLSQIHSEAYYINMAIAWAISVCFVHFREQTLTLLSAKTLPAFVQNKSLQKIRESLRVSKEDKVMLLALKI